MTRSSTGSAQSRAGSTTCAFVRRYVRPPRRAKAIPDALRTTTPPAAIWMRTADGKTFWTVADRGLGPREDELPPRSGATATRRNAATKAPPRLDSRRVVGTSLGTGDRGAVFPAGVPDAGARPPHRLAEERAEERSPAYSSLRRRSRNSTASCAHASQ